jgi:hypothetical protein
MTLVLSMLSFIKFAAHQSRIESNNNNNNNNNNVPIKEYYKIMICIVYQVSMCNFPLMLLLKFKLF